MQAETRPHRSPRPAVRPPRAPAHSWRTVILQHLPLLVACGLLIAGSGYVLTVQAEATTVTVQPVR